MQKAVILPQRVRKQETSAFPASHTGKVNLKEDEGRRVIGIVAGYPQEARLFRKAGPQNLKRTTALFDFGPESIRLSQNRSIEDDSHFCGLVRGPMHWRR